VGQESGRVMFELATGSSVEIDLGDLERDEARELLVSEEAVEEVAVALSHDGDDETDETDERLAAEYAEMDALLEAGCSASCPCSIKPTRNWLRRVFACGFFVAAFWLAQTQLSPWLD
jgi:hypothetical protein